MTKAVTVRLLAVAAHALAQLIDVTYRLGASLSVSTSSCRADTLSPQRLLAERHDATPACGKRSPLCRPMTRYCRNASPCAFRVGRAALIDAAPEGLTMIKLPR
jgi:hypothetical protein